MLGSSDTIHIDFVVEEILKMRVLNIRKIGLLKNLKKYEGHNDNFKSLDDAVKKLSTVWKKEK
jgi:hypothetical protein